MCVYAMGWARPFFPLVFSLVVGVLCLVEPLRLCRKIGQDDPIQQQWYDIMMCIVTLQTNYIGSRQLYPFAVNYFW